MRRPRLQCVKPRVRTPCTISPMLSIRTILPLTTLKISDTYI